MVYGTLSAFHLWNLWTQSQRHPQSSSFPANKNTRRLMMQRDGDYLRLNIIVYFKIQHDEYFIACYLRIMLDFFYGNQFFYITFAFDLCSKKANYFSLIFFPLLLSLICFICQGLSGYTYRNINFSQGFLLRLSKWEYVFRTFSGIRGNNSTSY